MAFGRGCFTMVFVSVFIVMAISVVSIHSARAPGGVTDGIPPAEISATAPSLLTELQRGQPNQVQRLGPQSGDGTPEAVSVEVSARVVPTGPDPLHHNHSPNHKP